MSNNGFINYYRSPAPPAKAGARKEAPKNPRTGAPKQAFIRYDRTPAPGLNAETIVLPLRPDRARTGVHFTETQETIKMHDLGRHIAEQVGDALRVSDAEGRKAFHWYTGCCKGAGVLDERGHGPDGKIRRAIRDNRQPRRSAARPDRAVLVRVATRSAENEAT